MFGSNAPKQLVSHSLVPETATKRDLFKTSLRKQQIETLFQEKRKPPELPASLSSFKSVLEPIKVEKTSSNSFVPDGPFFTPSFEMQRTWAKRYKVLIQLINQRGIIVKQTMTLDKNQILAYTIFLIETFWDKVHSALEIEKEDFEIYEELRIQSNLVLRGIVLITYWVGEFSENDLEKIQRVQIVPFLFRTLEKSMKKGANDVQFEGRVVFCIGSLMKTSQTIHQNIMGSQDLLKLIKEYVRSIQYKKSSHIFKVLMELYEGILSSKDTRLSISVHDKELFENIIEDVASCFLEGADGETYGVSISLFARLSSEFRLFGNNSHSETVAKKIDVLLSFGVASYTGVLLALGCNLLEQAPCFGSLLVRTSLPDSLKICIKSSRKEIKLESLYLLAGLIKSLSLDSEEVDYLMNKRELVESLAARLHEEMAFDVKKEAAKCILLYLQRAKWIGGFIEQLNGARLIVDQLYYANPVHLSIYLECIDIICVMGYAKQLAMAGTKRELERLALGKMEPARTLAEKVLENNKEALEF